MCAVIAAVGMVQFNHDRGSGARQLANCVSFAFLKRESPPTPNIQKYGIHEFFDQCWERGTG
jgi:hypothetical protein